MYLNRGETRRLRLRKLERSDIQVWEKFFIDNSSLPYLGLDLSLNPQEQSDDWINRQLERYKTDRFGHLALIEKQSGKFLGQCGLLSQDIDGKTEIEVGYHIIPEFWGQGFATEASRYIRDYAFQNDICESLISIIDKRNTASRRVAEKNGFSIDNETTLFGLEVYIFRLEKHKWSP